MNQRCACVHMLKVRPCPYVHSRKGKRAGECEALLCGTSYGLTRYFSRGSISNASPNIDRQYSAILACCFGLRKDRNNIGVFSMSAVYVTTTCSWRAEACGKPCVSARVSYAFKIDGCGLTSILWNLHP